MSDNEITDETSKTAEASTEPKKKSRKIMMLFFWALFILIATGAGYLYYNYSLIHPSTDDAYVQAHTIRVAAQVDGKVTKINVQNNQHVKEGDLLFKVNPRPYQFAFNKAKANVELTHQKIGAAKGAVDAATAKLAEAQANYTVAQKNVPRTLALAKQAKVSKAQGIEAQGKLDAAKATLDAAKAQVQEAINNLGKPGDNNAELLAAKATLQQAKFNLDHTQIYAPADGYLVNFTLRPGAMIAVGNPLFALVDTHQWWVNANYKETDLGRIKPNQPANIQIDIYPHHIFHGRVQSVSRGSGAAFSLLPPENATGNWVKVTQRFTVKILITNPSANYPLRVGASASATVTTK